MNRPRVILVPGMACDERVFQPQRAGGLEFETASLPMPTRREGMADYARRIRDQLRLDGPCIVGGVSFGGMIACELAHLVPAVRVLLVASCTTARAVPFRYRVAELVSRLLPDALIERRIDASTRNVATRHECITDEQHRILVEMARATGVVMLRRIARMILRWEAPPQFPCPVHAIHGDRDWVIPVRGVRPEQIVAGGGHLINITHAPEVNSFLARHFEWNA